MDGNVDRLDLDAWSAGNGMVGGAQLSDGDADRDGDVDGADFLALQGGYAFDPCGSKQSGRPRTNLLPAHADRMQLGWAAFKARACTSCASWSRPISRGLRCGLLRVRCANFPDRIFARQELSVQAADRGSHASLWGIAANESL